VRPLIPHVLTTLHVYWPASKGAFSVTDPTQPGNIIKLRKVKARTCEAHYRQVERAAEEEESGVRKQPCRVVGGRVPGQGTHQLVIFSTNLVDIEDSTWVLQ